MNLKDLIFLNIRGVEYHCIVNKISKSEVINLLQNADLSKKVDYYEKWIIVCGNIETKKRKFPRHKNLTLLEDGDFDNIQVSSMYSPSQKKYKYFIDYKNNDYRFTHNLSKNERRAHM